MSYSPFDLTGQTALITGGTRGIGFGMAEALARAGAALVIWGFNPERTTGAGEALTAIGGRVRAMTVNVTDEDQVRAAMDESVEWAEGRIDTVIANAVAGRMEGRMSEFPTDRYREILAVNTDGFFFTVREACRHMVERGKAGRPGGCIIGLSSLAGFQGAANNGVYAATKGAVPAFINTIATEYSRFGVRANTIVPGWIATDRTETMRANPAYVEKVLPRIPLGRWGEPKDFGGIVVYLASEAAAYHTGDTIVIDGGYQVF